MTEEAEKDLNLMTGEEGGEKDTTVLTGELPPSEEKPEGETTETENPEEKPEGETTETSEEKTEVPEEYEDFDLPEGVELDKETWSPVFKDIGLTQEQAQKLVAKQSEMIGAQAKEVENFKQTRNEKWVKEISADPEYETKNVNVNRLINNHDPDRTFRDFMEQYDLGPCKPIFDLLASVSSHFGEDKLVEGEGDGSSVDKPGYMTMGWDELK